VTPFRSRPENTHGLIHHGDIGRRDRAHTGLPDATTIVIVGHWAGSAVGDETGDPPEVRVSTWLTARPGNNTLVWNAMPEVVHERGGSARRTEIWEMIGNYDTISHAQAVHRYRLDTYGKFTQLCSACSPTWRRIGCTPRS
jgi:hypothetical protein